MAVVLMNLVFACAYLAAAPDADLPDEFYWRRWLRRGRNARRVTQMTPAGRRAAALLIAAMLLRLLMGHYYQLAGRA